MCNEGKKGLKIKIQHQHIDEDLQFRIEFFKCLFSSLSTLPSRVFSLKQQQQRQEEEEKLHSQSNTEKAPAHDSLVPKNEAEKMCVYIRKAKKSSFSAVAYVLPEPSHTKFSAIFWMTVLVRQLFRLS
jgi:hypothetical protein